MDPSTKEFIFNYKQSLLNVLKADSKNKSNSSSLLSTDGIEISNWKISNQLNFNCLDFAGQEIYYDNHTLFLSSSTIYILVFDMTQSNQPTLIYWLKTIQVIASDSPIFLVGTHNDVKDSILFTRNKINDLIDEMKITKIVDLFEVSCIKGSNIDKLRKSLIKYSINLIYSQPKVQHNFLLLEELVIHLRDVYNPPIISFSLFENLCSKCKINDTKQAIEYLHNSGVILYLYSFSQLNPIKLIIINPSWLTQVTSSLFSFSHTFGKNSHGLIQLNELHQIWSNIKGFPIDIHPIILDLLQNFDILFQLDSNRIIIPSFLPLQPPSSIHWICNSKLINSNTQSLSNPSAPLPSLTILDTSSSIPITHRFDGPGPTPRSSPIDMDIPKTNSIDNISDHASLSFDSTDSAPILQLRSIGSYDSQYEGASESLELSESSTQSQAPSIIPPTDNQDTPTPPSTNQQPDCSPSTSDDAITVQNTSSQEPNTEEDSSKGESSSSMDQSKRDRKPLTSLSPPVVWKKSDPIFATTAKEPKGNKTERTSRHNFTDSKSRYLNSSEARRVQSYQVEAYYTENEQDKDTILPGSASTSEESLSNYLSEGSLLQTYFKTDQSTRSTYSEKKEQPFDENATKLVLNSNQDQKSSSFFLSLSSKSRKSKTGSKRMNKFLNSSDSHPFVFPFTFISFISCTNIQPLSLLPRFPKRNHKREERRTNIEYSERETERSVFQITKEHVRISRRNPTSHPEYRQLLFPEEKIPESGNKPPSRKTTDSAVHPQLDW